MMSRFSIPDQREGERVVFHFRRHWFIFLNLFLIYFGLSILPLIIIYFVSFNYNTDISNFFDQNEFFRAVGLTVAFIYYMAMLVFTFTMWTENYLDVWTVTSERIISREQKGLFNRVVSGLGLTNIQDVTVEQKGMVATLLQYGDIYVQTAAEKERFVFQNVPNPYRISKTIQELSEQARHKQNYPGNGV